jgi:hypothetical protein
MDASGRLTPSINAIDAAPQVTLAETAVNLDDPFSDKGRSNLMDALSK